MTEHKKYYGPMVVGVVGVGWVVWFGWGRVVEVVGVVGVFWLAFCPNFRSVEGSEQDLA